MHVGFLVFLSFIMTPIFHNNLHTVSERKLASCFLALEEPVTGD